MRLAVGNAASIATSNDIFNEAVRRAVTDLYMLVTDTEEGHCPYAGIPWFSTAFGRDALITALETLWLDQVLPAVKHLAANQARQEDPAADAEPGKILHEVRYGDGGAGGGAFPPLLRQRRRHAAVHHAGRRLSGGYWRH